MVNETLPCSTDIILEVKKLCKVQIIVEMKKMVDAFEGKGKTKVLGSSPFLNCTSKAITPESSSSRRTEQGESSSSVFLPPKKRNSVPVNVVHENQNNVAVVEEPRQNENTFPFKKRKFLYRDNEGEVRVQENEIQDANLVIEDNAADKVGQEIINEMKVDVFEAKDEEGKKEIRSQVSNPISLIAIAASWLADAEAVSETVLENKPILPQAYAIIDDSDKSEISEEFEIHGDVNNIDEANGIEQRNVIMRTYDQERDENEAAMYDEKKKHSDELNETVTEKTEIKQFRKPRSSIPRRPKTFSTLQFNDVVIFVVESTGDKNAEKGDEQIREVQEEVDINNEDLYSKVKKRHQMGGKMPEAANGSGQSRCTRVNGKGWRCSNYTRVGFALCEHHLGRQEMLRRVGDPDDASSHGKQKGKPKYGSLKTILEQTPVIAKW